MISKEYRDFINSNLIHHMRTGSYIKNHWLEDDIDAEHKVHFVNEIKKVHNVRHKVKIEDIVEGVQLSTNGGKNFFDVKSTIKQNIDNLNIGICVDKQQSLKLDYLNINLLGMENHKLPKVFISYSRKDLEFKDELKSHLSILEKYDLLKA